MEAVNCLKEKKRMCNTIGCSECGLSHFNNGHSILCHFFMEEFPEEAVRIVEEWSKEHSMKTMGDKFKEIFGVKVVGHYIVNFETQEGVSQIALDFDAPYEVPKGEEK